MRSSIVVSLVFTSFSISAVAIASPLVIDPPFPPAPPAPPAPPVLVMPPVLSPLVADPPAPPRAPRAPDEELPPVEALTETEFVTLAVLLLLTVIVDAAKAAGDPASTRPSTAPAAVIFLKSVLIYMLIN
jgi:hypothetical protein